MDGRADSASSSREEAYRKRRRSYNAAMSDENSLDDDEEVDDDDENDGAKEEESYPHRDGAMRAGCCRQRECNARKISSLESETCWSTESLVVSKRTLTRESSGDTAKSWSEIEIPELLLAHPEILSYMRCRCFVPQFSACRCRCGQCQHQRRKISSTSSCLGSEYVVGHGAKRKDSGNSVSTCQTFLPSSSGRNSLGSLYHSGADNAGDNGATIQRRHSIATGPIFHRRSSTQTHSLRGYKITRSDNRRLSEQPFLTDAIGKCESVTGTVSVAEPIIVGTGTRPRQFPKATTRATQSTASLHREISANIKPPNDNESPITDDSANTRPTNPRASARKNSETNANHPASRKNSAIPITPKMMRRRFSEQLILEGGLGSGAEIENLLEQGNEEESLTAINARKKITLNKHYYPEGGWGYVIVVTTILVHLISHGLQLASGLLMSTIMTRYKKTIEDSGTI